MNISFDLFTEAFLRKISEYDFITLPEEDRTRIVDNYMKKALSQFRQNCKYDFYSTAENTLREFNVDIPEADLEEIVDIVSEGMVVQWLKPYTYRQDLLENTLNTKDFSQYSPANLVARVSGLYEKAQSDFQNMIKNYSFNKGKLKELHN